MGLNGFLTALLVPLLVLLLGWAAALRPPRRLPSAACWCHRPPRRVPWRTPRRPSGRPRSGRGHHLPT